MEKRKMKRRGVLLIVSGPSGAGKGTLVRAYVDSREDVYLSVSATTRSPRAGEVDGTSYHFTSYEQFMDMVNEGQLLEWAEYCGNCYGTPKAAIEQMLAEGKDVILEIDVQGAMKIRSKMPEGVFIFVLPPSMEVLKQRLIGRESESNTSVIARLKRAQTEFLLIDKYNYVLVNDTIEQAISDLDGILRAEKCRIERNKNIIQEVCGDVISFN
ncbi:MAG: guanylate kinase [Hyphomonadaceae bacterium]|nr:guanylate kinase [Clostridia bacterium]